MGSILRTTHSQSIDASAEDNPKVVELVQMILEHLVYDPIVAMSAEQGVNLAASYLPDLILLDISLPDEVELQQKIPSHL